MIKYKLDLSKVGWLEWFLSSKGFWHNWAWHSLRKMHCLGFFEPTIQWFRSYLTNRLFSVNVGNEFSSPDKSAFGVPQGSIFGPLLLLLHGNDMLQAVSCELLLYADDTCLICTRKDIKTIEVQLNKDFNSVCEWFIDNKLNIHFGEEKTKSILFSTTKKLKNSRNLDFRYEDIEIKQHSKVPGMYPRQQYVWRSYGCQGLEHDWWKTKISIQKAKIIKLLFSSTAMQWADTTTFLLSMRCVVL